MSANRPLSSSRVAPSLRKAWRSCLVALLVGAVWYVIAFEMTSFQPTPWSQYKGDWRTLLAFSLGALAATWILRQTIVRKGLLWTLVGSLLWFTCATLCVSAILLTLVYASGGSIEEVQMESTIGGKTRWSVYCIISMALDGAIWGGGKAPYALPLILISLLLLRCGFCVKPGLRG